MFDFPLYDTSTAPEGSRPELEDTQKRLGFLPNFYAKIAASPEALKAYKQMAKLVSETSLSPQEQQVAFLAISQLNECSFCVAAHSMVARMSKVDESVVQALREGRDAPDDKLNALARFARALVEKRGFVDETELKAFFDAGYGQAQVFEVLLIVAMKTLSNYANHIGGETPTNEELAAHA